MFKKFGLGLCNCIKCSLNTTYFNARNIVSYLLIVKHYIDIAIKVLENVLSALF